MKSCWGICFTTSKIFRKISGNCLTKQCCWASCLPHQKTSKTFQANLASSLAAKMEGKESIKGSVIIQKKNVLDLNDFHAGIVDNLSELLGKVVSVTLVGIPQGNSVNASANLSEPAYLQNWRSTPVVAITGKTTYPVEFKWHSDMGTPAAFFIKNTHRHEFFLNSLTLELPGQGRVHFVCNSWVYPASRNKKDRIFFSNRSYLPSETPPALLKLRNEELISLRGDGTGEREELDRLYDYDFYNDLGNPDKGEEHSRQVLGGSQAFPYPRRGRTGRPPTKKDPASESRLSVFSSLDIFVPRDERFGHLKLSDFLGYAIKSLGQFLQPELKAFFDSTPNEFDSFEDIMKLYSDGIKLPDNPILDDTKNRIPLELIKELVKTDSEGQNLLAYPTPQVIARDKLACYIISCECKAKINWTLVAGDKLAWRKDEEFARQMLSGVNPVIIQRLQSFPPRSELDPEIYGAQESSVTVSDIEQSLDGLTVKQALDESKLFILDHHDTIMPYVNRINALKQPDAIIPGLDRINPPDSTKIYATRTILFLKEDGTLKPVAIELSLPPLDDRPYYRKVLTPAEEGVEGALWHLAKAYVAVNDSGHHQLISHWLRTHAVTEPFIIATNRQLSVMHPIHKLLSPHFRDTMNINAFARQILINAGGVLERTVFPGKYAMEMSAVVYKGWRFDEEGLPADLLKRGMAVKVEDKKAKHGLRLTIEDYPYAVDGLEIWSAIESWVEEYLSFYYKTDEAVASDTELQAWWYEIRNVGHGDKKDEPWWYEMQSVQDLGKALTTIIWVASALHAAVNFGQYPYAGYMPNRPTVSRRLIPEEGSKEFTELKENPDLFLLRTISNQFQTTLGIALIEILSRHSTDEVYLGQRASPDWTDDERVAKAFERFGSRLKQIEENITDRNNDKRYKNRSGPAEVPYTLLYPNTSDKSGKGGLTGKGIPNSVSI
ncbi:probable linoleate 9S-lipoxygenase 5 isoform X2 [Cryptomeria japonica]|uniref:probable linoleate 9S-lipoxygenase 5 isoform X2 n=1 Tax=Cryptomeria japonica TaxID=3369 RepID=UPI0027DA2C06|nr:probable linoleate 9S-lipoxygenase 5 isoform X2 [Cryptomeria japonica]